MLSPCFILTSTKDSLVYGESFRCGGLDTAKAFGTTVLVAVSLFPHSHGFADFPSFLHGICSYYRKPFLPMMNNDNYLFRFIRKQ